MKRKQKYSKNAGISLPAELIERIDKAREDVSRSRYVLRLLEQTSLLGNAEHTSGYPRIENTGQKFVESGERGSPSKLTAPSTDSSPKNLEGSKI